MFSRHAHISMHTNNKNPYKKKSSFLLVGYFWMCSMLFYKKLYALSLNQAWSNFKKYTRKCMHWHSVSIYSTTMVCWKKTTEWGRYHLILSLCSCNSATPSLFLDKVWNLSVENRKPSWPSRRKLKQQMYSFWWLTPLIFHNTHVCYYEPKTGIFLCYCTNSDSKSSKRQQIDVKARKLMFRLSGCF